MKHKLRLDVTYFKYLLALLSVGDPIKEPKIIQVFEDSHDQVLVNTNYLRLSHYYNHFHRVVSKS